MAVSKLQIWLTLGVLYSCLCQWVRSGKLIVFLSCRIKSEKEILLKKHLRRARSRITRKAFLNIKIIPHFWHKKYFQVGGLCCCLDGKNATVCVAVELEAVPPSPETMVCSDSLVCSQTLWAPSPRLDWLHICINTHSPCILVWDFRECTTCWQCTQIRGNMVCYFQK